MDALVGDLEGLELSGRSPGSVDRGADETPETNLVFSYMNLARAFAELELGADLYSCNRNRWWQTKPGPLLYAGAFVAGLEYAAHVEAVVLGQASAAYFAAALEALDGRSGSLTGWWVTISTATFAARMESACAPCSCAPESSGRTRRARAEQPDGSRLLDLAPAEWLEEHPVNRRRHRN